MSKLSPESMLWVNENKKVSKERVQIIPSGGNPMCREGSSKYSSADATSVYTLA